VPCRPGRGYRPRVRLHRHDHHADGLRLLRCRVIAAIRRVGTRFSVTVPVNANVRAAIAAIGEDTWTGYALRSDCSPSTTLSTTCTVTA